MPERGWERTADYVGRANVTRLMRAHGIGSIAELRRRAGEDIEWYWDAAVRDLGLEFAIPYERVLDTSKGIPWATWFTGGRVNPLPNSRDRWAGPRQPRDRTATMSG